MPSVTGIARGKTQRGERPKCPAGLAEVQARPQGYQHFPLGAGAKSSQAGCFGRTQQDGSWHRGLMGNVRVGALLASGSAGDSPSWCLSRSCLSQRWRPALACPPARVTKSGPDPVAAGCRWNMGSGLDVSTELGASGGILSVNIGTLLPRHARYRPDHLAVVFEGDQLTFAQLNRRVNRRFQRAPRRGISKGQ